MIDWERLAFVCSCLAIIGYTIFFLFAWFDTTPAGLSQSELHARELDRLDAAAWHAEQSESYHESDY